MIVNNLLMRRGGGHKNVTEPYGGGGQIKFIVTQSEYVDPSVKVER